MRLPQLLRALRPARGARAGSPLRAAAWSGPRPILVGIDGSAAGMHALEWAVIRAWAGQTSVHVVHALQAPAWLDPQGLGWWSPPDPGEAAHRVLEAAVARAHQLVPELQVTTSLRGVTPSTALLDEGRDAELIVLGRRRPGRGRARRLPRVAAQVVRGARGRVVVVSQDDELLV
jgi:nucleotide-binding universal stress UspA family protein